LTDTPDSGAPRDPDARPDALPEPRRETQPRRSVWRNLSLIWLVPLGALGIVLWIAWENYANRGALIEITFQNASGVIAGETTMRYRDVVVGTVESVGFTEGLADVTVGVRVDNQILPYLDDDAQFWVVRPEVSAQGISGLSTVLSGAYIAAAWDLEQGDAMTRFSGFERAPLAQPGLDGVRIVLRTDDGTTVAPGAPVLYRGVQVGQLEEPRLTNTGETILVEAFIEAPHDQLVTSATRFWDTSGFSVSLGAGGISLDVDSIASLVSGGVSFARVYDNGEAVVPGQVFELYENEAEARRRPFLTLGETGVEFVVRFPESAAGLSSGADVTYRGLQVGQVGSLRTELLPGTDSVALSLTAVLEIDPQLMGLPPVMSDDRILGLVSDLVDEGLRAQIVSEGLLGGSLAVALVEAPDAPPAALRRPEGGLPEIPAIPRESSDFAASAQGLLEQVAALPLDEALERAIGLMESVETLVRQDSTQEVPGALVSLLDETRALVASDDMQALPADLRGSVTALEGFIVELEAAGLITGLTSALDAARIAAEDVSFAVVGIPDLVEELDAVARSAGALPLDAVVARVESVLESADALISSEETQDLPVALTGALEQVEAALADLRAGGTVENLNATLASARDAADSVARAADDLPELTRRLNQLVVQAEALVGSYGERSDFNAQSLRALREVSDAARAVTRLAREIERNPNSLLFGR
jgi:paraquat-inducible protein B